MQKIQPTKFIISGGGTGGHIFPAVAIANQITSRHPDAEILFVGANGRMEMEKVPQAGYKITGLDIAGFQRGSIIKNIFLPFKLGKSLFQAYSVLRSFRPDVAIGVGGYASGPLLQVANFLNIPTVLQEQNSFAGITNKLLAKKARVICVAYEGMEKVFPANRIRITGNPVRRDIASLQADKVSAYAYYGLDPAKKTILIIGGSLGARTLNQSVVHSLERIKAQQDIQILWQTGKVYFEQALADTKDTPQLITRQFLDRMDYAYTCADIIISRAGALSISELQCVGKPVILVPSPNVSEDHQTHNAMALVKKNAAILIKDDEAKINLIGTALDLLKDTNAIVTLSTNIKQMARPDAAEKIVDEIYAI
jgi:UDP-N-acetylglucosamine--N-acetylmuramyl-(pentapeptide) pyrophosphoryl-undecaprenol N-acetylglucosamine transferase